MDPVSSPGRDGSADEGSPRVDPARAAALDDVKRRARKGVVILVVRTVLVQLAVLGGQVVLARLLEPRDFGVFAVVQFALAFFGFFGDAGLGGGLIQKRDAPTHRELSSVFFVQLLIVGAILLAVGIASEFAGLVWRDLPAETPWLIRALSLGLLLTTLRTIPCILMERELSFAKLAIVDVVVSVVFYLVAASLALAKFGVWALVVGVLAQGLAGLVTAQLLKPFVPGLALDRGLVRPILRFGVPFQLNRAVGFLNSAVTPLYAGSRLGTGPLGLINWAQTTAYFPLKLVEIVSRVAFPLYSRLQDEQRMLGESFGRSVQLCASFTFFMVALLLGMGTQVIDVVFGEKWLPALPVLHVYACAISLGFFAPLIGAVLDATGRPRILLNLSLFWTALNWVVVPLTTSRWGMLGFAWGYSVHVVAGNVALLFLSARLIPHARLLRRVWPAVCSSVVVYGLGRYVLAPVAGTALIFVPSVLGLFFTHLLILLILDRRGLVDALKIVPGSEKYVA